MASSFSSPLPSALAPSLAAPYPATRPALLSAALAPSARRSAGLGGLLVVGLALAAAMLLAPEQPVDQAAICERHNGAQACRVW